MRRKISIIVLTLTGLLAIAAGVAWYLLHNEAFLKKELNAAVLSATGRSLQVEGPLTLQLGSELTIEANNVHFVNAAWAIEPTMVDIGMLRIKLELRSLFSDLIVLNDVEINDCRVALIENDQGVGNWDVLPGSAQTAGPEAQQPRKRRLARVARLQINNCRLTHDAPSRKKPLSIIVSDLSMTLLANEMYESRALGEVNERPLSFSGRMGPVRALWQGGYFEHNLEYKAGAISLQSSGSFTDARTGTGANLSMRFSGPEFSTFTDDMALPPFSSGPFNFSLQLNTENKVTSLDLDGDLGSLDVWAKGEFDRLLHPSAGQVNLHATGPNLKAVGQALGFERMVEDEFTLDLDAKFEAGKAQLSPSVLHTNQDRLEISGTLGAWPNYADSDLQILLHSDEIGRWALSLGEEFHPKGLVNLSMHLSSDSAGQSSVQSEVQHLQNRLKFNGTLGKLPSLDDPDVHITLNTTDSQFLSDLSGLKNLPAAPILVAGQFSREGDGLRLRNVELSMDGQRAKIDGLVKGGKEFVGSNLSVQFDISNTASFGALFHIDNLPAERLQVTAVFKSVGQGLDFQLTDGKLGTILLTANGRIADLNTPGAIDANFDFRFPSLKFLSWLFPEKDLPDLPFAARGQLKNEPHFTHLIGMQVELGKTQASVDAEISRSEHFEGSKLSVSGSGSDLKELLPGKIWNSLPQDFTFSGSWARQGGIDNLQNVVVEAGNIKFSLNGTTDNRLVPRTVAAHVQANGPDASTLNELLGRSFEAESFAIDSQFTGSAKKFDLSELSAQLGASQLHGDLQIDLTDKPHVSGSIKSEFLDLSHWTAVQKEGNALTEVGKAAKKTTAADRLFDDTPVLSTGKSDVDLELDVDILRADLGNTVFENIQLGIVYTDDLLRLDPLQFSGLVGSDMVGSFVLDGRDSVPQLDVKFTGKDIRLGLSAVEGQDPSTYPPIEMDVFLQGKGHTRHELANSLNGRIRIYQGSGLIAAAGVDLVFSDFISELFLALNPFAKHSEYSTLDCGVVAGDVVSGQLSLSPIIFQTKEVTIFSGGTINLDTEQIDLTFNTKARTGIGINAGVLVHPFIKVGGTLLSPAIELDATNAVISSGAAVATVGISLLAKSFSDRFLSSKDPCGDARKKLEESDAESS